MTNDHQQSEPQIIIPRRPRGRPRASEPGSTVSVWLPASYHDRLVKMAANMDESVSTLVRSLLTLRIDRAK